MKSNLRAKMNALEGRLIHLTDRCPNGATLNETYRRHTRFFETSRGGSRRRQPSRPSRTKPPGVFMIQLTLHPGRGTRKALACISEPISEIVLDPEDGDIQEGELVCSILKCAPLRDLEAGRHGNSLSLGSSLSTTNHKRLALDMLHLRMWFKTITDIPRTRITRAPPRPKTATPQSPSESRQQPQEPVRSPQQGQQPDSGGSSGSSKSRDSSDQEDPELAKLRLTRRGPTDAEQLQTEVHRVTQRTAPTAVILEPRDGEKARTIPMSLYLSSIESKSKRPPPTAPKPLRVHKRPPTKQSVKCVTTTYKVKRRKQPNDETIWKKKPEPTFVYRGPHCSPHVTSQWDYNLNNYYGLPQNRSGNKKPARVPPKAPKRHKTFCLNGVTPQFQPATPTPRAPRCGVPRTSYCLDDAVPLFQPISPTASQDGFPCAPPGRSGRIFDTCTGMPEANEARARRKARGGAFTFPEADVKPAATMQSGGVSIVNHNYFPTDDSSSPRWNSSEEWRSPKPVMHKSSLSASPKFDDSLGTPPRQAGKRTPSPRHNLNDSEKTPPREDSTGSPQTGEALAELASLLKTQFTDRISDEKSTRLNAYNQLEKLSVSLEKCPDVPEIPLTCDLDRSTGAILLPYKNNRSTPIYKKFPKASRRAGLRC